MKIQPPKKALKFLRWFCREDYLEEIEGDLIEIFEIQVENSQRKANWKFTWSVVRYFRPEFIKSFKTYNSPNLIAMLLHNLLITFRTFKRYKSSFLINLVGLSTGLTCALLIYFWVYDEVSVDKFHKKDERLFQVLRNIPNASNILETHEANSILLPQALETEMPGVEYVTPVRPTPEGIVSVNENHIKATGWFVGEEFFNTFSYNLISGNKSQVLQEKYAAVISDELAVKLFGSIDNCIGKSIVWDLGPFGDTHIISGIFEKPSENSSAKFDFVVTHEMFLEKNRMDVNWSSNPIMVYLTLKPGVNKKSFNDKLNSLYKSKRINDAEKEEMFLQRYSERYLFNHYENGKQSGGRIDYVILFSIIGMVILSIACINFMNLSTARASRRFKEVGIKKTIGVPKRILVFQHLGESLLIAILSLLVAVIISYLLLPQFNQLTGKQLTVSFNWDFTIGILAIVFITGLVSGSYPAFYLSRLKPIHILKGKLTASRGELWIRKGLVVFQFSISLLLIIAVAVIYMQMNFVQSQNLGYKKDNVVSFEEQGSLNDKLESFLSEANKIPGVVSASSVSESIANINSTSWGHNWEGKLPGLAEVEFSGLNVNFDFFKTMGIKIKEGRSFSRDFGTEGTSVILNEAAVEAMGIADPIGKWIELFNTKRKIVGIVNDFHFQSMYEEISPLFIICNPKYTNKVIVKIETGKLRETVDRLETLHKDYNPGVPFEFTFLDDEYQALYISEQRIGLLSKYFASTAILISCLGLLGLTAFTAERRIKEIGIRKIMGASLWGIISLLSADFFKMILLAIVIALPIGYFLSANWLEGFAYHIELEWWHFSAAGLGVILIVWFTVGFQTIKVALLNPVNCLKDE